MHTLTQNARQLPSRSTDCTTTGTCSSANKRLDLSYAFDANGNVGQITDNTSGGQQTRSMTYDALDRLTGANQRGRRQLIHVHNAQANQRGRPKGRPKGDGGN